MVFQAVPTAKGQALADEYGMQFYETVSYWNALHFSDEHIYYLLITLHLSECQE